MTSAINANGCAQSAWFVALALAGSWTGPCRRSSPVREHPAELVFIAGFVAYLIFFF
jgi:hypothetical protein